MGQSVVEGWDDEGSFETVADQDPGLLDLEPRDPFDLSKALEGAALEGLHPDVCRFRLHAEHQPAGDQPAAIEELVRQLEQGQERCVLLGVTGSGKTFAMANLIERLNVPTLILSHNKTLARQLHHEIAGYFPENAVEYFVSHYDYYQPEAYLPKRDLYIDKELSINERIEQERFSAVASLVSRPDCVIVSSVSCIYGLNPPETFLEHHLRVHVGQEIEPQDLMRALVELQYARTSTDLERGQARLRGEVLDVWMPSRDDPLRIRFDFEGVKSVWVCDPVSWEALDELDEAWIHPKEFFMTSPERFEEALERIEDELSERLKELDAANEHVKRHRLEQRTEYDLEMLREVGHCLAIENYSRHFDGRAPGERPYCLLDFFAACARQFHGDARRFLVIMDESHVTLPQVGGMYHGDRARKENLIEHGFRLPSAADNRPLKLPEFQNLVPQMVYVSATPGERELRHLCETTGQAVPESLLHAASAGGAGPADLAKKSPDAASMYDTIQAIRHLPKMEIRPTGLLDPTLEVRPTEGQVADLLSEINARIDRGQRTLVTVLTIKFAEEVAAYLNRMGVKAHHLHSEIDTIERTEIINALRLGLIDVIVGINLLREGLDIPEVSLVAIFDADRQGFLRNERSLLQTIGRAARNQDGTVVLYADGISPSMEAAIRQTLERRARQMAYNESHGIVPRTIVKALPSLGQESEGLLEGTTSSMGGGRRLVAKRGGRQDGATLGVGAELMATATEPERPIGKSNIQLESDEENSTPDALRDLAVEVRAAMEDAARALDFEEAARLRDRLLAIEERMSISGD
jgi:excinuclease ABC subunit B